MRARVSSKGPSVPPRRLSEPREPGGESRSLDRGPEKRTLEELLGCVGYHGPKKTLAEIDQAVHEHARTRRFAKR
jgi:hypothetical protein